jgi:hypothetical protein
MSDIYIEVDTMYSKATDANPDFENTMPPIMKSAAEETAKKMKSKGITTKKPNDKKAKGYYFGGTIQSLTIENGVLKCELSMVLSSWPGRSLVGTMSKKDGKRLPSNATDEQIAKVAEELISEATADITEQTLKMVVKERP